MSVGDLCVLVTEKKPSKLSSEFLLQGEKVCVCVCVCVCVSVCLCVCVSVSVFGERTGDIQTQTEQMLQNINK